MLRNAPKFYEIAKRVVEITDGCILVAHNAQFDYRILSTEFSRLGFDYERESLCTVELSKYLIPGQASYSLGKLVRALGIPVADRHRASGDAQATVKLFKMLLDKDSEKKIIQDAVRLNPKRQLEPRHLDIIAKLPSITGVYYIHKDDGEIIYIGKSNNIKKRINQHFTNTNPKSKKIQTLVAAVTYEATGSELVALLKESEEIKKNKPVFNRALKRNSFTHALYSFLDNNGYLNLSINKVDKTRKAITTFSNLQSGKSFISKAISEYNLCQKLVGEYKTTSSCFNYDIKECLGACVGEESVEIYNKRVELLISKNSYSNKNMVIVDKGRDIDERSAILIKNGVFQGLGFFNLNYQINNLEVLESIITPMQNNRDTQHIIQSYLRRNKKVKQIIIDQQ
ncbi:exonuclease [Hyunsoonleella pacifica]|nr:exonuclease [Hyunsoonleella pacifica]